MNKTDLMVLKDLVRLIHQRFQQHEDEIGQVLCNTLQSLIETLTEKPNTVPELNQVPYPEWVEEAIKLRKQGLPYTKIARVVKKSDSTVRRWIIRVMSASPTNETLKELEPATKEQELWARLEQKAKGAD